MFDLSTAKQELSDAGTWLSTEFFAISTGRAHPGLVESINVESYGSFQPIKNIANISVEEARTLRIAPWDKNMLGPIQKAIQDENLPFSVSSDAAGVRLTIPVMTEENRKKIVKLVKEKHEEARVRVRMAREKNNKLIDEAEKVKEINEDAKFKSKEELQKMVDAANSNLDVLLAGKEKEIMTI